MEHIEMFGLGEILLNPDYSYIGALIGFIFIIAVYYGCLYSVDDIVDFKTIIFVLLYLILLSLLIGFLIVVT